jgi:hypothetical protein
MRGIMRGISEYHASYYVQSSLKQFVQERVSIGPCKCSFKILSAASKACGKKRCTRD